MCTERALKRKFLIYHLNLEEKYGRRFTGATKGATKGANLRAPVTTEGVSHLAARPPRPPLHPSAPAPLHGAARSPSTPCSRLSHNSSPSSSAPPCPFPYASLTRPPTKFAPPRLSSHASPYLFPATPRPCTSAPSPHIEDVQHCGVILTIRLVSTSILQNKSQRHLENSEQCEGMEVFQQSFPRNNCKYYLRQQKT